MISIKCGECSQRLGSKDEFAILVIQESERPKRESYHFVRKYDEQLDIFEEKKVTVEMDLHEDKYFIVNCRSCDFEVGKKFVTANYKYIAFAKDKILYDDFMLEKTDRWYQKIKDPFFMSMTRVQLSDFTDHGMNSGGSWRRNEEVRDDNPRKRKVGIEYMLENNIAVRGPPSTKDYETHKSSHKDNACGVDSREYKSGGGRAYQSRENNNTTRGPSASRETYGNRASSNAYRNNLPPPRNDNSYKGTHSRVLPERKDIGSLLEDRIEFINSLPSKWNSEQIYYELTGPNKKNWESITTKGLQSDMSGRLLRALLNFLTLPDISSHKKAAELFACLNTNIGQVALMMFFQMGQLAADTIKTAVDHGCGGHKWITAMKDAQNVCEAIYHLMSLFIDCQINPMLPIEQLSSRIRALLGEQFDDEASNLSGWYSGVCDDEKQTHINSSTFLYSRLSSIERIKQSAIDSAKQIAFAKEEEEKQSAEVKRQLKQRSRDGIRFLDDCKRDRDYLDIHVVPLPEELLSAPPIALPKNLVLSLGKASGEAAEIEDDFLEPLASPVTTTITSATPFKFRSIHHYLNTHFQLNREDCLAQLRRGIAKFREQLIANANKSNSKSTIDLDLDLEQYFSDIQGSGTKMIDSPSPTVLRKVANFIANSRENDRVYVYENVCVRSVEQVREGIGYAVSFDTFGVHKNIDWSKSSRFMNGSLLCLSRDGTFNEDNLIVATVLKGVKPPDQGNGKGWKPTVLINIESQSVDRFDPIASYVMIESMVFFEAYRPVLKALQNLGNDGDIPFAEHLLGNSTRVLAPEYLFTATRTTPGAARVYNNSWDDEPSPLRDASAGWDMSAVFPAFQNINSTKYWNPLKSPALPPLPSTPELDESQKNAIKLALTRRLAIIQGPPGTGKTFVGVLISKLLLANKHLRCNKPILFICQTNHALDQMLEHVYKFNENIIRIGGRSESPIMQELSIMNAKKNIMSQNNSIRNNNSRGNPIFHKKFVTLPRRDSKEYEALERMRMSLTGLCAAFSQRGIVVSEGQSLSNCHLARLQYILDSLHDGDGDMIDGLIDNCHDTVQAKMWTSCKTEYNRRNNVTANTLNRPDWTVDYDEWKMLPIKTKLILQATYAPQSSNYGGSSQDDVTSIWLQHAPNKRKKLQKPGAQADNLDWQTVKVRRKNRQLSEVEEEEEGQNIATNLSNLDKLLNALPGDKDNDMDDCESILSGDSPDRNLDDADAENNCLMNDGEYAFDFSPSSGSGNNREENMVERVINRPVNLDRTVRETVLASLETLRTNRLLYKNEIWNTIKAERELLMKVWSMLLNYDAAADVKRFTNDFLKAAQVEARYNATVDSVVLRSVDVIGMTTNGAAKYNELLRALKPDVIVVEEAAEVLEASVVAAFTKATKHVILIGDHLQLRPQVSEYGIATQNGLEVSLFERLVRMGIPHVTLTTQRRMHPEISALIQPAIYKHLLNAPSVSLYPPVNGIPNRLYFISHTEPEDGQTTAWGAPENEDNKDTKKAIVRPIDMVGAEMSKTNLFEAKYLIRLLYYLLLNGYKASQIVVLSMYKGQLMLLKRLAKEHARKPSSMLKAFETLDKVRMTTTDNYQGEESDLVLLSLVRSNKDGKGGFVTVMNRVCVALSRAKHGMFVIGNFTMMRSKSPLWEGICKDMEERGRIGKALVLQCHSHPATRVDAASEADFDKCPHGGCMLRCDTMKPCGHICKLLCHYVDHSLIMCNDACERPRPPDCTHPCRKPCGQTCGPCMKPVTKFRNFCGHTISIKCFQNVDTVICPAICGVSMVCGHSCPDACHLTGHDMLRYKCEVRCPRTRSTCSHPCPKYCHEECGNCLTEVNRELDCGHKVVVACSVDVTTLACKSRCSLKLPCGHQCSQICGLPCDALCTTKVLKTLPLCRYSPRHWKELDCSEDATNVICDLLCGIVLNCGHKCEGTCATCTVVDGEEISPHIPCIKPCQKRLACNHMCNGNHPCNSTTCPPCSKPCGINCGHGPCELPCGVPCIPCTLPCQYTCNHLKCMSLCHEIHTLIPELIPRRSTRNSDKEGVENSCNHNVNPRSEICQQNCTRNLSPCGHVCRGICGEICPRLCVTCNPEQLKERLFRLTTVQDVTNIPLVKFRFLELACGHAFEVRALDMYMSKYRERSGISSCASSVEVPACPECGVTVEGIYRYRDLLRTSLQRLVPEHQERFQKQLIKEVYEDLTTHNAAGAVVERLRTMIASNIQHERYSKLSPLLHLLLGQASMKLGGFHAGSRDNLRNARDSASGSDVKREALVSIGLCYLGGLDGSDKIALKRISEANLMKAKEALSDSIQLTYEHHDLLSIYKRTDRELVSLITLIQQAVDNKREDAEAQKKEKETKLKEMIPMPGAAAANNIPTQNSVSGAVSDTMSNSASNINTGGTITTNSSSISSSRGGSALHMAACRGDLPLVKDLVKDGADVCQRDDLGNTPLLCAAENACKDVLLFLAPLSPWHTINHAQATFLDIVLDVTGPIRPLLGSVAEEIEDMAREKMIISQDSNTATTNPSHEWAALKYFQACRCSALDELMDMIGLRKVKAQSLDLFYNVTEDMKRPVAARMSTKQATNFIFLGNPGTGKTTVARLLGKILEELGLRGAGKFVETSGQKLLQDGSSKFPPVLQSTTPGVLFIDEVYQLDPKGNQDGKAITNMIMQAAEDDRDKLTVIVAGYSVDVREKWVASNSGISSRFPFEITFEDFSENELYTILLGVIRGYGWMLDRYNPGDGSQPSVNTGLVVARRLARGANKKGFANARSVRVLVENAMRVASKRQKAESQEAVFFRKSLPPNHSVTLTLPDFLGSPIDPSASPPVVELMSKIGLDDVKRAVLGLLELVKENYISELNGERVLDICLNRMFLGNPGTGKTTIAKLYGSILKEMGLLSNGEVVLKGASELVGDVVGSTAKKVNELIDSCKGKVLVIDEAYVLARANSIYGKEALDTLVERVQGTPGEDIAVILCGYEEEMKTMLRDGNPGLSRRFRAEDAFYFADYDDNQLTTIMVQRAKESFLHVTEALAKQAVINVLAKQRAKPNFGNVGAVNNLLEHGKERMMKRSDKTKVNGSWVLIPEDLFEEPPPDAALMSMSKLVNAEHIIDHIQQLQKRVKVQLKKGTDPKTLLKNYFFIGPPGTGKTTVARAFGEVFHGLGLLSTSEVVECKAMELIASYVGQTSGLMRDKMNEARGGVLFIDEAYGLDPSRSVFSKDAIETLLANMTDPKYEGNMVIILAGYKEEIEQLLRSNPGLHRRITEQIEFHSWSPAQCLTLLLKLINDDSLELPISLHNVAMEGFEALSHREGWGNAGDVNTVYSKMRGSRENRCDEEGNVEGGYTHNDIIYAFTTLFKQRPASGMGQKSRGMSAVATANGYETSKNPSVRQNETPPIGNYKLDEEELVQEWVVDMEEEDSSDEELWSSLDKALQALDYDLYKTRDILKSQNLPVELVAYVSNKLNRHTDKVTLMLVKQCPVLLPRVEQLIISIEKELIKQREVRERIESADAAEKERLQREEKERQKAAILERVKQIGRCPAGFNWNKVAGGYRCGGGSHFVKNSQLKLE